MPASVGTIWKAQPLMPATRRPFRGEVWLADLDPVRGHEQAGRRPVVVVSHDTLNQGPAGLAVVVPISSVDKHVPLHVALIPGHVGLLRPSWARPENIRSISTERLVELWGSLTGETMAIIDDHIRIVLDL